MHLKPPKVKRNNPPWLLIGLLALAVIVGGTVLALAVPTAPKPTRVVAQPSLSTPPQTPSPGVSSSIASSSPSPSASRSTTPSAGSREPLNPRRANCAPRPSRCGLPDGTNTGVPPGTRLTVLNGDQKITRAGTVIDGKDIRGCVEIEAPRVTIRRSKISCTGFYVVANFAERYSGGGALLQDVEISCQRSNGTGVGDYGLTAVRVNIHDCENGFDIDNTITVRDSYIHDPYNTADNHADGIQLNPGRKIVITHNTIFAPRATSAIIGHRIGNSEVLVSGNLLSGGAYTLYCPNVPTTEFRVVNNRFSTIDSPKGGAYGPWTFCENAAVVTGNVWDATLKRLNPR